MWLLQFSFEISDPPVVSQLKKVYISFLKPRRSFFKNILNETITKKTIRNITTNNFAFTSTYV